MLCACSRRFTPSCATTGPLKLRRLCFCVRRPIQRFWVLETVARIPYFAYISILHLYESLGFWRAGADLRRVHFAEEWNELHHLQVGLSQSVRLAGRQAGKAGAKLAAVVGSCGWGCAKQWPSLLLLYPDSQCPYLVHSVVAVCLLCCCVLHSPQIMESLGGDQLWFDRFLAEHSAILYYWVLILMYLLSPKNAYAFSELVEWHATDTYAQVCW